MRRLIIIFAVIFSLTAFCVHAFAANETDNEQAAEHEELLELGRFAVLGSTYNRGMGKAEIYFGYIGNDGIENVFAAWLNDEGLGSPITEYEVLSDGTAEGEAAAELYLQSRTIAPGTEVLVAISDWVPDYKSTDSKVVYQSGVKRLVFCGRADLSPDDYAKLYDRLNNGELYAQDRLIQFEYSFEDGALSVNRIELEQEEYADSPKTGLHFATFSMLLALMAIGFNKKH